MSITGRLIGASVVALAAAAVGVTQAGAAVASPPAPPVPAPSQGSPAHIFYVMMENHGYDQVIGNTADAPFINALAARYDVATNFHGVTHPSLPNYLAAVSGSYQGIFDDCAAGASITCAPEEFVPGSGDATSGAALTDAQYQQASSTPHLFDGKNLIDQVEASGRTWKAYMENLPGVGSDAVYAPVVTKPDGTQTTVKLYAQKHNPFMYFSDINSPGNPRLSSIVPLEGNLARDLEEGTVPNLVWISPNQCHDMHGVSPSSAQLIGQPSCGYPDSGLDHGAIQLGDDFVRQTIGEIMDSPVWKASNSQIVLSWDENDYSGFSGGPGSPVGKGGVVLGGGQAPLIVISSQAGPHRTTDKLVDHYSVLRAIENEWHLGCLAASCGVPAEEQLTELFAN